MLFRSLLTQLLVEPNHEVRLRGVGPALAHVLGYVRVLEESKQLHEVRLRYSTERSTTTGTQIEFELTAQQRLASVPPPITSHRRRRR